MIILLIIAVIVLILVIKFKNAKHRAENQIVMNCWTNETKIKAVTERFSIAMGEAADRTDRLVVAENSARDLQLLMCSGDYMPSDSWFEKQAIKTEASWAKMYGL
jgi:hypothetical protein